MKAVWLLTTDNGHKGSLNTFYAWQADRAGSCGLWLRGNEQEVKGQWTERTLGTARRFSLHMNTYAHTELIRKVCKLERNNSRYVHTLCRYLLCGCIMVTATIKLLHVHTDGHTHTHTHTHARTHAHNQTHTSPVHRVFQGHFPDLQHTHILCTVASIYFGRTW